MADLTIAVTAFLRMLWARWAAFEIWRSLEADSFAVGVRRFHLAVTAAEIAFGMLGNRGASLSIPGCS
ncbi:MAG: hypothetical protein ABL912_04880 [Novosphingobium sp.]